MPDESFNPTFDERSFLRGLKLYYNALESLKGHAPGDVRLVRSQGLAQKLFHHAASAFWLYKGSRVPDMPGVDVDFIDHSSITLIARGALECYLIFYYIFVDPSDEDEFEFRYNGWMLAGLALRERHSFRSPELQPLVASEKPRYEAYRNAIRGTKAFQRLKPAAQDKVETGERWRFPGFVEIAEKAGFGPKYVKSLYGLLSDYAHSGALAALQVSQADSLQDQRALAAINLNVLMVVLCKMIGSWTERFPKSAEALDSDAEAAAACDALSRQVRALQ